MGWIVLAVAFAAVWVYAFYREDRKNPEPLWLVGLAMLGGMAMVPVSIWIETRFTPDLTILQGTLAERFRVAFFVAGPVEELCKFFAVALLVLQQKQFDEPMDGIVYAASTAAGFALVENLLFMQDQPSSILARGPAATGAHILFATIWGGALGHAKHINRLPHRLGVVYIGLVFAFLAHGAFDLTTWSAGRELVVNQARAVQLGLLLGCAAFLRWRIKVALKTIPVVSNI